MNKAFKRLAVGTVIAGAAGYVAGLLTAPKSGKATRKDIKDATDKTVSEAEKQLKKLHTELGDLLDELKTRSGDVKGKSKAELDEITGLATDAKQKAREILTALHEGETNNKDLKKAMDEAGKAVTHLKAFLKKKI
jgi:gas vesicle protein